MYLLVYAVYCKPPCDRVIVIRASSSLSRSRFVLAMSPLFSPLTIHDLPLSSDASDPANGYKLISGVCEESVVVDVLLLSTPIFIFPVPSAEVPPVSSRDCTRGDPSIRHKAVAEGDIQYRIPFQLHRSCARCLPRCNVPLAFFVFYHRPRLYMRFRLQPPFDSDLA